MFDDLKEKLSEYVDTPVDEITEDTRFIEDLGMNSFQFMSLLGYLEEEYDIVVDESEVRGLSTVGDAVKYIEDLTKE
ncbi:MAG TPA: acyl carrier protein [Candidatus Ornithomonoglobus intestinigallinarum]|jgi:acyl carrier protein|uniref:Acyl carrier protein n=1 Tax=Candidatus Ornithomonoglobus intestinigallinarum TaxID=2840894 RepID=A0A9D1H269_9FIRM|nr:acyl carrier protein [Candidatus Ornithomonoglobus intestinigallinarum]